MIEKLQFFVFIFAVLLPSFSTVSFYNSEKCRLDLNFTSHTVFCWYFHDTFVRPIVFTMQIFANRKVSLEIANLRLIQFAGEVAVGSRDRTFHEVDLVGEYNVVWWVLRLIVAKKKIVM